MHSHPGYWNPFVYEHILNNRENNKLQHQLSLNHGERATKSHLDTNFMAIDPLQRSRIQQEIRRQQKIKLLNLQIEAERPQRRQKILAEAQDKISQKEGYLQRIEFKLKKFQQEAEDSQQRFKNQLIEEERDRQRVLKSVKEQCQKNVQRFQQRVDQKRKQLEDSIAHQRKVIEKLNEEAILEAGKKLSAAENKVQDRKSQLEEGINRQKQYYNTIIQKMGLEVAQARKEAEEEVIEAKIRAQQQNEVKKKSQLCLKNIMGRQTRTKQEQSLKSYKQQSKYNEQYVQARINAQRVLRQQQQINGNITAYNYKAGSKQWKNRGVGDLVDRQNSYPYRSRNNYY